MDVTAWMEWFLGCLGRAMACTPHSPRLHRTLLCVTYCHSSNAASWSVGRKAGEARVMRLRRGNGSHEDCQILQQGSQSIGFTNHNSSLFCLSLQSGG